jgi:ABC-type transport system involved in cytochrome bd biosynthesis fused ATPase/permease subunit
MLFGEVSAVVVSLLIVSLCAWVCGVLQQRKGWRIVGAGNLLASWLAAIFSLQTSVDYTSLLIMLASTGFVLGIVTWLNQTYGDELANN